VKTVSLYRASILSKLYLEFQKIEQNSAHAVRDGSGDITKTKFLQTLNGKLRLCTEKRFSLSYHTIYAVSDSVNNSYQWKSPLKIKTLNNAPVKT